MMFRKIPLTFLILTIGVASAYAKKEPKYEQARQLTADQAALVQRAVAQEKVLIKNIQLRTPLVETYIQDTRPDVKLYEVPTDDQYMLSRVDFGKGFFDKTYVPKDEGKHGFFKGSFTAMTGLSKALGLEKFTYNPNGFMQMMFIDPSGFDQQHYVFSFVRREFVGSVRTWVYDMHPKADVKGIGRFYGRIWIEDEGANVVRFNGTYTGPTSEDASKYFFHFDSWRMNVQPGIWLPAAVYVEETQRTEANKQVGLKAQTHFWGYSLKLPTRESENVSVKVDEAVDKSDDSQDVGPLQASRMWITQAENNVIDRLVEAGLVAPLDQGGYENKVLDQIVIIAARIRRRDRGRIRRVIRPLRIVDGKPSKNPRYLQPRPDTVDPRGRYLAEVSQRLRLDLPSDTQIHFPVDAVLAGRRNSVADPAAGLPPLAVYGPIHYQELPELFMDLMCSLTGKIH